jgi:CheY-like chemotaxis protein
MIEWNMPVAVLCATSMSNAMGLEIPGILRADPKTSHIPVIAIGDRGQQSQLETLRAGYADFIDRRLGAEEIAAHVTSILSSYRDGFQPTQMLARSETALDGRLSLVDLPGVIQVLAQSRQTGGLHINADSADGIIFFDAGEIVHAECGHFAGDDAIVQVVKSCYLTKDGVYKFIPGDASALRTVQGSLNALILEAMRQLDEEEHEAPKETLAAPDAPAESAPQAGEPESDPVPTAEMEPAAAQDPVEIEAKPAPGEAPVETGAHASVESEGAPVREVGAEPEAPGPADFGSIMDAETLRGLNELLVSLSVGGTHTHE